MVLFCMVPWRDEYLSETEKCIFFAELSTRQLPRNKKLPALQGSQSGFIFGVYFWNFFPTCP